MKSLPPASAARAAWITRKKKKAKGSEHYHQHLKQGLCRCKQPVAPGKKRCQACLDLLAHEAKERNARYYTEGRCRRCPRQRLDHTYLCEICYPLMRRTATKASAAYVARQKAAGLCTLCGGVARDGAVTCGEHTRSRTEYSKKRYRRRRAQGLCGVCGETPEPPYVACEHCRRRKYKKVR